MRSDVPDGRPQVAHPEVVVGFELPASLEKALPQARRRLRAWLSGSKRCAGEVIDIAELLVTEMVSNAIRHTRVDSVPITLSWRGRRVRVGVEDSDGRPVGPPLPVPSLESQHGRGLWLIDRLASRWGSQPRSQGKVVWFELECPDPGTTTGHRSRP